MPNTENVDPIRENDRTENDEPKFVMSNTDTALPIRPTPKTESADPSVAKLLNDRVEPMWIKSYKEI
jgi:hypothetical protein